MEYSTSIITIMVESFLINHSKILGKYSSETLQFPSATGHWTSTPLQDQLHKLTTNGQSTYLEAHCHAQAAIYALVN